MKPEQLIPSYDDDVPSRPDPHVSLFNEVFDDPLPSSAYDTALDPPSFPGATAQPGHTTAASTPRSTYSSYLDAPALPASGRYAGSAAAASRPQGPYSSYVGTSSPPSGTPQLPHVAPRIAVPGLAHVGAHAAAIDSQPSFKAVTDEARRNRYRVTIEKQMKRAEKGIVKAFDTLSIKRYTFGKYRQLGPDKITGKGWEWRGFGRQRLGVNDQDSVRFEARAKYWVQHSLIWVCVPGAGDSAVFYSHVGKLTRFHHSSFTAGQPVIGAGEWIVVNGHLKAVNANSGHYRPTLDQLYQSVLHMREALQDDTTVMLWSIADNDWVDVRAQEFLDRRSDGGRLKAHPMSL